MMPFSALDNPAIVSDNGRWNARHILVVATYAFAILVSSYCTLFSGAATGFMVLVASGLFLICLINFSVGLAVFIASILFSPEIYLSMNISLTGRPVLLRAEDILSLVFLFGWFARLSILREYRLIKNTPLNWPIFLFLVSSVVSTFYGWSMGTLSPMAAAFFLTKYAQYFFIFFLVVNCLHSVQQIKTMLMAGFAVIMAFCVYAYWKIPSIEIWSTNRLSAPFGRATESTSIGGILAFVMAILIAMMLYAKQRALKFWLFGGVLFIFVPFLYTLSRTSYLAFGFALFTLWLYSRNKALAFSCLLLLLLSPIVLPQEIMDRIAYTWRDARAYGVDPSTQERILVFLKIKWVLRHSPLLGFGVSAFDILDNQYVKTLVETGFLGFGLFLWILIRVYKTAYRVYTKTRIAWAKGFGLGYIAGFWGLVMHGFGAITFTMVRTMEMFWILTALIFVYSYLMDEAEPKMLAENPEQDLAAEA